MVVVVVVVVEEDSSPLLVPLLQRALVVVAETRARAAARVGEKDHEKEESVAKTIARPPSFMRDNNKQDDLSVVLIVYGNNPIAVMNMKGALQKGHLPNKIDLRSFTSTLSQSCQDSQSLEVTLLSKLKTICNLAR